MKEPVEVRAARRRAALAGQTPTYKKWLEAVSPEFCWDWPHLNFLYPYLAKVAAGEIDRLMIFMPPQHGKSSVITERFPAYLLECNPRQRIIVGSYNKNFATRFSRRNRRIASNRLELAHDRKAASEWETTQGGGMLSVGVGSGVTGNPADVIIIDDPIKSREEAESDAYRSRLWDWYLDDLYTRLQPGSPIILIQTRWHEKDLAGMLLAEAESGGDKWGVVSLPAIAEENDQMGRAPGRALCPARFDEDALEAKRRVRDEYSWASLYQQRPTPRQGGLFDNEKFEYADAPPSGLEWFRYWDLAASQKRKASFTASVAGALAPDGTLWLRDGVRFKKEWPDARGIIREWMIAERSTTCGIEAKLHGLAAIQEFLRDPALTARAFVPVDVDTDKYSRALPWAARLGMGKITLVRGSWTKDLLRETSVFPNGAYADMVDCVSGVAAMIALRGGCDVEYGDPVI